MLRLAALKRNITYITNIFFFHDSRKDKFK